MKYGELIDACIEIIKNYNPVVQTLDSHADEFTQNVRSIFCDDLTGNFYRWKTLMKRCSLSRYFMVVFDTKSS